jgi:hypothetical protein
VDFGLKVLGGDLMAIPGIYGFVQVENLSLSSPPLLGLLGFNSDMNVVCTWFKFSEGFSSVDGRDQMSLFQILGVWWKDGCRGGKKEKRGLF